MPSPDLQSALKAALPLDGSSKPGANPVGLANFLRALADLLDPPPPPERPRRVMFRGTRFHPLTNNQEDFAMVQTVSGVRIRGSAKGYISGAPIEILNERGKRMEPQPHPSTIQVTPSNLEDAYMAEDGRAVIIGDDSQPVDAEWACTFSADATGTADDGVVTGFYDPDAPGTVDVGPLGTMTVIEGELPPRAQPPAG